MPDHTDWCNLCFFFAKNLAYVKKKSYLCGLKNRTTMQTTHRFLYISVLIACLCLASGMQAQSTKGPEKPDLQTAEGDIFDPTRMEKETEAYTFHVEYRITGGYLQENQRSLRDNYPNMYLHGGQIGATFDFCLPLHFSIQTGLLYSLTYGTREEHWAQIDAADIYGSSNYLLHRVYNHELTVPVRMTYTIPLVKKFRMFFFGGPQFQIGLAAWDKTENHLTEMTTQWFLSHNKHVEPYDLYKDELNRFNVQIGVGGGFEWDVYRIEAGYDFGLNNRVKHPVPNDQHMWQWGWFARFAYTIK